MMREEEKVRERKRLEEDLMFYLSYYNEVVPRTKRIREVFDKEIEELIKEIKKLGH